MDPATEALIVAAIEGLIKIIQDEVANRSAVHDAVLANLQAARAALASSKADDDAAAAEGEAELKKIEEPAP